MRIKICSDAPKTGGNPAGLRVCDAETGQTIEGVRGIRFTAYIGSAPLTELSLLVEDADIVTEVTGGECVTLSGKLFRIVPDRTGEEIRAAAEAAERKTQ